MNLHLRPLAFFLISLGLMACGSMDEDGPSRDAALATAMLNTPEDALNTAAYVLLVNELDAASRNFEDLRSPVARKALQMRPKVSVAGLECPQGGALDFNDENRDDLLLFQFNACASEEATLNGRLELRCLAGNFSEGENSCTHTRILFGSTSGPLSAAFPGNRSVNLLGAFRLQVLDTSVVTEQSLDIEARDAARNLQIIAVTQSLQRDVEQTSSGGGLAVLSGTVGLAFAGESLRCSTGAVQFTTLDRLSITASGAIIGGRLRISNDASQTATVVFNSDGSVTATTVGGTATFPRDQFERTCTTDS